MQRNSETDIDRLAQPVDGRHHTRRADRDPALAEPVAQVVDQQAQRRHQVAEVRQRLTHAHEDDVADHTTAAGTVIVQQLVRQPHLTDDLGDAQVAVEALARGGAERTVQRAAHLRGNTQRAAVGFRYEYHLDTVAVLQP